MILRFAIPALFAALAAPLPAAPPPPKPPAPKLIVVISVDQFSADLYQRYRPTFRKGIKRLGGGIAFTGYQSHAATETCPGHSTILTGQHPAQTGIVANTWVDRATGKAVYCVSVPGAADPDMRGPQNLRADTLGDWMKRTNPASQVVAISGKDRAAIMLGGHHADAVYWWLDKTGFVTSPYASPAAQAVTAPPAAFNRALLADWQGTRPALWPTRVTRACARLQKPETFGALALSGNIPPDAARAAIAEPDYLAGSAFADALRGSPLFDATTLDFARTMVEQRRLGRGPAPDLLAISLSATDYIGHRYGAGGPEMCVQMAALDIALGAFLKQLDRLRVPYVVALTADHGGIDAAERRAEQGHPAPRIDAKALTRAMNASLRQSLALDADPLLSEEPGQYFLRAGPDASTRLRIRAAAVAWLRAQPGVALVLTADEIAAKIIPPGKPADQLTIAERYRESFDPARSGDIAVAFAEGASIGVPRAVNDAVAGHGTPWDYDRRVPILFWWRGVSQTVSSAPIETVDIAPTLAALAGIEAPPVAGRCLDAVARCTSSRVEPR